VTQGLGVELDSRTLGNVAVKTMGDQMARMLAKDYGVESKVLATSMVLMADRALLTNKSRMRQLGARALSEAQMETLQIYQDILNGARPDHEAVLALGQKQEAREEEEDLPPHFNVALIAWMMTVGCRLAGTKPKRVGRLPGAGFNAGNLSPMEKKARVGTLHMLAARLLRSGRLGKDLAASKKLVSDLAKLSNKM